MKLFVTGTGTDIGKTHLCCGLLRHACAAGRPMRALKPVVSGFSTATAAGSDPALLLDAGGQPVSPDAIAATAPFRFAAPLSPDMAAAAEGRSLGYAALLAFCRAEIAAVDGDLLIEGVGGVMVPLDDTHTVLDWIVDLGLPVLLVTGSYLGALSHALTAVAALRQRGGSLAAVVVNESAGSPVDLARTAATLARHGGARMLILPHPAGAGAFADLYQAIISSGDSHSARS